MILVGIAQLKAHLSEYVRRAQAGDTVEVRDRDRPVARLVPVPAASLGLTIRPAVADWAAVTASLRAAQPVSAAADLPACATTDSVAWLLEDRQKER